MTESEEKVTQEEPRDEVTEHPESGENLENPELLDQEEVVTSAGVIGFILVPLMLVLSIVGIGWTVLYLTHTETSVPEYSLALSSDDPTVRWKAAHDLIESNQASEELIPVIVEMMAQPIDEQTLNTRAASPGAILKTPEEREVNLRWYGAAALGKIGGDRAAEILRDLLDDEDKGVRFFTVQSLGRVRDYDAVPQLIELLKNDPDEAVRMVSAWSLGEIAAPTPGVFPHDPAITNEIRAALLEAFRTTEFKDVRMNSAIALARFGEAEVEEMLIEMTKVDDSPHTRGQARKALRALRKVQDQ